MKSQWITYNGQRILHMDLSNFKEDLKNFEVELNAAVTTLGQEMYQQPEHSVLVLVDLRNTVMTSPAQKLLTERIKDTRQYVKKTAVVGMTGLRRMYLDFFAHIAGSDTAPFDNQDSAKEWLVKAKYNLARHNKKSRRSSDLTGLSFYTTHYRTIQSFRAVRPSSLPQSP
jgi:hypothetical protein